jgi:hypothetical protein
LTLHSALSFHACALLAGLCGYVDYEDQYRGEVGQYTVRFGYSEVLSVTEARRIYEGRNEDVQYLLPRVASHGNTIVSSRKKSRDKLASIILGALPSVFPKNDELHLILTMARKLVPGGEPGHFAKPNCCRGRISRSYNKHENNIMKGLFALGSGLGRVF